MKKKIRRQKVNLGQEMEVRSQLLDALQWRLVTVQLCRALGWFVVTGEGGEPAHLPEIHSMDPPPCTLAHNAK